jgi:hypothetical protein
LELTVAFLLRFALIRKCTGRAPAVELAQVVIGVQTRSRSAAFASTIATVAASELRGRGSTRQSKSRWRWDGGGPRFMAAMVSGVGGGEGEHLTAGTSSHGDESKGRGL